MTHVRLNRKPFDKSFNNLVDDLFTELPVMLKSDFYPQWKGFVPVNITENPDSYLIDIVAPGFEKTDFKINLDQQVLTISADKKEEVKDETKKVIRKEYSHRSFKRSFTIDEKVDASRIEASYVNGVLTLNLPKKEIVKESAKEINIK